MFPVISISMKNWPSQRVGVHKRRCDQMSSVAIKSYSDHLFLLHFPEGSCRGRVKRSYTSNSKHPQAIVDNVTTSGQQNKLAS